jgi:stearoyl-CoA desaturase (delta-9 desaturase)
LLAAPYVAMHLGCLAVFWVGWSWMAVAVAAALYVSRMFALTAFYHRYFSHRAFKTSRVAQFVFAVLGSSCLHKGVLWWAAHHRAHHRYADRDEDLHSPSRHGLFWSHMGWFISRATVPTERKLVRDLDRFPELRFINRFHILVPAALGVGLYLFGSHLETSAPQLGTSGMQMLVWGFFISTVALAHASYTINSLSHLIGSRPYETRDTSRNNPVLALLTLGEGWHNNHHHYPGSVRQGFTWWEVDIAYYGLFLLAKLGIIWDLRPVPDQIRDARSVKPS